MHVYNVKYISREVSLRWEVMNAELSFHRVFVVVGIVITGITFAILQRLCNGVINRCGKS